MPALPSRSLSEYECYAALLQPDRRQAAMLSSSVQFRRYAQPRNRPLFITTHEPTGGRLRRQATLEALPAILASPLTQVMALRLCGPLTASSRGLRTESRCGRPRLARS